MQQQNRPAGKVEILLALLEWGLLLAGMTALAITETYEWYVSLGLALLAVAFLLRIVRTHQVLPRIEGALSGLEIPWLLGLLSAGYAAWMAYNQPTAFLQFARLLAACVLYYAVIAAIPGSQRWLAFGLLLAAAGLAVYWPLQAALTGATGNILQNLTGPSIHPNVAAGSLVVAVPFGVALIIQAFLSRDPGQKRQPFLGVLSALLTAVVLGGLALTGSRGAWAALAGVSLLAVTIWLQRRYISNPKARLAFWLGLTVGVLLLGVAIAASGNFERLLGQIPDPSGTLQSRTQFWKQGLELVRDYPFTGSGLMTFWMVHGSYALQVYFPFVAHIHNSFLEVWIEQGVVGALALLLAGIVLLRWAWGAICNPRVSPWGWAGLAAVGIAFLHGLVDVVFYVTRTLPLIGFVLGFAWFASAHPESAATSERLPGNNAPRGYQNQKRLGYWASGLAVVLGLAVFFTWQPLQSQFYANQGALLQTRLELSTYDSATKDQQTIHDVRQKIDLRPAENAFERALDLDPNNRTALQRLAQITFSRGEFERSLELSRRLWQAGYRDDVTRLLHGDALTANGFLEEAASILQGLTWAGARLEGLFWYRFWPGGDYARAADVLTVVQLLDPQKPGLQEWIDQAREKMTP
jgi:O-antigen ligase